MANNDKENKIKKFTKEAIGKTLNQFNKEIRIADLVEINKNQDRILNGILSQVNDENTEKTEKSNIITLDNSTDGIVELKEIQGDTNVNVSKIVEETPITHVIEDKEGSVISLDGITEGAINIDNIQGNTMVNCNKEADKELILMEDLSTEGYSNITLNKGVDGGKVDVALEGNTMVNVCDQKDPVAITKSYTVETGNHIALQGEYDGKARPVPTGNTLVNLGANENIWDIGINGSINTDYVIISKSTTEISINKLTDTVSYFYLRKIINPNLFKANTDYTFIFTGNNIISIGILSSTTVESIVPLKACSNGFNCIKVTSNDLSSITGNNAIFIYAQVNKTLIDKVSISDVIILEGDYTNKPTGYFEGLQSSFEDKVVPENLATKIKSGNIPKYNVLCEHRGIKQNTTYTLFIKNNSTTTLGFYLNENLFDYKEYNINGNDYKKILITPIKKITESGIIKALYYMENVNFECYLLEGDYTNYDFSDYDPTKAGKYKVDYVVTGKNKFNINSSATLDYYLSSNFTVQSGANNVLFNDYIKVNPNTTYTITIPNKNVARIIGYDSNKNPIKVLINYTYTGSVQRNQFTTDNNISYIRLSFNGVVDGIYNNINIQIEEGTEATPYEPYKEYKKTFYLNSPLLEGDTIEQQGNNVVHVHRSELRAYQTDDELTLPTDMTNTLVAKATPTYEVISQNDTILCDSYVNGHLDVDSVVPIKKVMFQRTTFNKLRYLYPNTTYTVQFESDNIGRLRNAYMGNDVKQNTLANVVKGINKFSFNLNTTQSNTFTYFSFDGIGFNASNIVVTEATDQDFGYFEGMKSVGECEDLEVVSSNFEGVHFTVDMLEKGFIDDAGNTQASNVGFRTKDYIRYPYKYGWVSTYNTKYLCRSIHCYDVNKNWLGKVEMNCPLINGTYYIKTNFRREDGAVIEDILEDMQFNITNTKINYVEKLKSNTQTLTHEPLRAVGDVKDKYVLIDGKWYIERNCGYRNNYSICDAWSNENLTNRRLKLFKLDNSIEEFDDMNALRKVKSNKFKCVQYGYTDGRFNVPFLAYITENGNLWVSADINYTQQDMLNYINDCQFVYELQTPTYEPIDYNPFEVYSDVTHISNNSTIPCNMIIKNTGYNCLLKPNTTYTVSSNLGLNTVTTPSTLTEDCLRFYDTDTSTVTTMKNVTVLEGDYTTGKPMPSHFSGIESCFEQEYDEEVGKYKVKAKVVGKNLFNGRVIENHIYNVNAGGYAHESAIQSLTGYNCTDLFHINPNTQYISSVDGVTIQGNIKFYDKKGKFISQVYTSPFTTPYNARYCSMHWLQSIVGTGLNLLLEQGTEATSYEPYKESVIEFYIDEPLRGIKDVKDKVYVKNDKVVVERNCAEVILDGSDDENITFGTDMDNTYVNTIQFFIKEAIAGKTICKCICDKFNYEFVNSDNEHYYTYAVDVIIFIAKSKLQTQDVSGFRQWLQQNPTTIVYQLAEPIYEEVEYSSNRLILNTFNNESFNNSTLFLDTNILPKLSFKPLWEELVYIKNSTKYYIQFNAVGSGEVVINLGGTELTTEIVEGYNCIPITTPSESTNLMTISGQGITISEVVVSEVVCGGYYKGLQSCFEEHMENGKYRVLLRGIALDGSKVNGIKLYINEPLRGIGDVKDRLCIKNGKLMVERNCAEVMFGINSQWFRSTPDAENYLDMRCHINSPYAYPSDNGGICNTIPYKSNKKGSWITKDFGITCINISNQIQVIISIEISKLKTPDINGFKRWLSENPTTVIYQLQTPIYEEVTNEYGYPIVLEGYENGIVYIDSAVTPTTHIKYTSNNQLATTLSEAEEQNIATQEDINMNVVTYMMDIDMILTEMEMSNDTSVMAVRRDSSNENMLDRMSEEDKKVYRDNTVVMLEKMITAKALEKEDIEGRINMYYNKNRISKEQYEYLKSLL